MDSDSITKEALFDSLGLKYSRKNTIKVSLKLNKAPLWLYDIIRKPKKGEIGKIPETLAKDIIEKYLFKDRIEIKKDEVISDSTIELINNSRAVIVIY